MTTPSDLYSLPNLIGSKLMLTFHGKERVPDVTVEAIRRYRPAGFSLFRAFNVEQPAQVRRLTAELQQAARATGLPPFLIAADQEGGQLMAIGDGVTQLPGNLALGAAGSADLARKAGWVLGRELAAMGLNVNFAPVCDVNVNPRNPVVGTRSFGEDPQAVAELSAALVEGIQSAGVAATAKHFPGHGDTASDSHHGAPVVPHSLDRLQKVELPPFRAAIEAGARLVMSAHLALPALTGRSDLPATLSPEILTGLLRRELGFRGVIVTDALDMGAIHQGEGLGEAGVQAALAGADLLLVSAAPEDQERVYRALNEAGRSERLDAADLRASTARILALKSWLEQQDQPDLSVVACAEHQAVADEIAARSITLVRDDAGLLPLRLKPEDNLALVLPQPSDLTPADTSSYVSPVLGRELHRFHPNVSELSVPSSPGVGDIAAVLAALRGADMVILGTINAFSQSGQAELAQAVLASGIPTIIAALRMPYDLASFPSASTYLCAYSLLEPSMRALARVLFGQAEALGRLPVSIPGLYPRGHSLEG